MMKKYEASTLEEACAQASKELECSVEDLDYNIVQYPSKGILGFFSKKAIIVAINKKSVKDAELKDKEITEENITKEQINNDAEEENNFTPIVEEKISYKEEDSKSYESEIVDSFFSDESKKNYSTQLEKEKITAPELEEIIKKLLLNSCFEIDTIEVDVDENTAYVFIDGDDAALLIGKEGYRYNALSYLLFNWINAKYGLYLKLEIAQFLASQQDMIKHQMQAVVEHVSREGWGKTRELNGILVQIALEHLRDTFPNKYVAIKRNKNGERYIVINEFNKK